MKFNHIYIFFISFEMDFDFRDHAEIKSRNAILKKFKKYLELVARHVCK